MSSKKKIKLPVVWDDDILQLILLGLPLKDLVQCKLVCKHWNTLISRFRFTLELSSSPNTTLLVHESLGHLNSITIPGRICHEELPQEYRIVGACDGLICLSGVKSPDGAAEVWVWNPYRRQKRVFKYPNARIGFGIFGFGVDCASKDYKVVRVAQLGSETSVEIRNLYADEPRVLHIRTSFVLTDTCSVTTGRWCHWIAVNLTNKNLEIVRFDMETETFVEIPFSSKMPNIEYDVVGLIGIEEGVARRRLSNTELVIDGTGFRLGVYKERVCLFITDTSKVEIWGLATVGYCWRKLFEDLQRSFRKSDVLGFTADNELAICTRTGKTIYGCNPWTKRFVRPLANQVDHDQGEVGSSHVVAFTESIVPVFPDGRHKRKVDMMSRPAAHQA